MTDTHRLLVLVVLIILLGSLGLYIGRVPIQAAKDAAHVERAAAITEKPLVDGKFRLTIPVWHCDEESSHDIAAWLTKHPDREQVGGVEYVGCTRVVIVDTKPK